MVYLPAAEHSELAPEMLEGLEAYDLLAVDDVDALAGLPAWERALFNLYNKARQQGTRMLFSATLPADCGHPGSGLDRSARRAILPNFANMTRIEAMSTMNISLPDGLKAFIDEQVAEGGYGTVSEYVRELIRKEQDRVHMRNLLLEGAASHPAGIADTAYFEGLREQLRRHTAK